MCHDNLIDFIAKLRVFCHVDRRKRRISMFHDNLIDYIAKSGVIINTKQCKTKNL